MNKNRQHGLAFRFVRFESSQCLVRCFGFVELPVDQIVTGEHKARVAIGWSNFYSL